MAVYPVREDTLLVKENLKKQELKGKKFLEIGVGNGEIALTAAKNGAKVTGVDINPEAVQHTKKRFEQNDLDGEFFESDLFEEIEGKYDFVVFNPPYLKGEKGIGYEKMWRGGETGLEIGRRYLKFVEKYLVTDGEAWIVLSSTTNNTVIKRNLELVECVKLWFEEINLFRLIT